MVDFKAAKPDATRDERIDFALIDLNLTGMQMSDLYVLTFEQKLLITLKEEEMFQSVVYRLAQGVPWPAAGGRKVYGWSSADSLLPVRLTNVHSDIPHSVLIEALSRYGTVVHYQPGRHPRLPNVNDGTLHIKMTIPEGVVLPSFIGVYNHEDKLDTAIQVFTDTSTKRCYRCGQAGHIGAYCRKVPKSVEAQNKSWCKVKLSKPSTTHTTNTASVSPSTTGPVQQPGPKAFSVTSASDATSAPAVPETSAAPEAPNTLEVLKAPKTPETPKAPEAPEAPKAPQAPEAPEGPETPEASESPVAPKAPEASEAPEGPMAPLAFSDPVTPMHFDLNLSSSITVKEDDPGSDPPASPVNSRSRPKRKARNKNINYDEGLQDPSSPDNTKKKAREYSSRSPGGCRRWSSSLSRKKAEDTAYRAEFGFTPEEMKRFQVEGCWGREDIKQWYCKCEKGKVCQNAQLIREERRRRKKEYISSSETD